jgi:hypothetical protein
MPLWQMLTVVEPFELRAKTIFKMMQSSFQGAGGEYIDWMRSELKGLIVNQRKLTYCKSH